MPNQKEEIYYMYGRVDYSLMCSSFIELFLGCRKCPRRLPLEEIGFNLPKKKMKEIGFKASGCIRDQ